MITRCWSFFALFIILLMSGGCGKTEPGADADPTGDEVCLVGDCTGFVA